MHAPFWWFSLVACVLAVFVQSASARQQSDDLAARQETGSQETRQADTPPNPKNVAVPRESHEGGRAAHENRKGPPTAHERQKSASAVREKENQKNESPGARERRALRDKLNAGLVG